MQTLSIRLDDSIYEHFKEFLKFYPQNKLSIIEDDGDTVFTESNTQAYNNAMQDFEKGETIKWKQYAASRNINV
ncbi:MAG: hypothetical protein PHU41_02285 [Sulfuricurvum sp.]|nr:hypothetical protein [Sulfuricurvum sp.]